MNERATCILAIETSCDETAAAIVRDGRRVLSNVVASQSELHAPFGGVFPEVASRQHIRDIHPIIQTALESAGVAWRDLDAVAVTRGPGLSGALLVGVNAAKGIAMATGLPLLAIHHIAGHIASHRLCVDGRIIGPHDEPPDDIPEVPHIALVVSGGHSELYLVRSFGSIQHIGGTLDDAAGEAFDKAARMLGLGYPGGPAIQAAAEGGDPTAFRLPVGRTEGALDLSFSGLKTALLRVIEGLRTAGASDEELLVADLPIADLPIADLAASFQAAVAAALAQRVVRALEAYPEARAVLVSGGVAANIVLRETLQAATPLPVRFPPLALCTDNAAMIAAAAHIGLCEDAPEVAFRAGLDLDVMATMALGA